MAQKPRDISGSANNTGAVAIQDVVRDELQDALIRAMKERDGVAVRVLRSVIAAIGNAEAVTLTPGELSGLGPAHGVGATDVPRRTLTEDEITDIIRDEVRERQIAAADYERLGHRERARALQNETVVLAELLQRATLGDK